MTYMYAGSRYQYVISTWLQDHTDMSTACLAAGRPDDCAAGSRCRRRPPIVTHDRHSLATVAALLFSPLPPPRSLAGIRRAFRPLPASMFGHFSGEVRRWPEQCFFYSAPLCKRCTSYGNSVCLSVCLSVRLSKRRYVARCSLHRRIAKCVYFCINQKIFPRDDPFALKSSLELTHPLLIAASLDTFCLVAPQP